MYDDTFKFSQTGQRWWIKESVKIQSIFHEKSGNFKTKCPCLAVNVSSSPTLQCIYTASHLALLPSLSFPQVIFLPSNFTLTYTSCLACPLPLPPSLWALARGVRRFQLTKQKPCSPPPPLPLFKHQPVFLSSSCCCTANNWGWREERIKDTERKGKHKTLSWF